MVSVKSERKLKGNIGIGEKNISFINAKDLKNIFKMILWLFTESQKDILEQLMYF